MNPLVTVTIPTRNSSRTRGSYLEAFRNQTYSNIVIISVDTKSTDDTVRIYTPGWSATLRTDTETTRFESNLQGSINRFSLSQLDTSGELEILYEPQQGYFGIIVVSIIAVSGCFGFVAYNLWRRSKNARGVLRSMLWK